MRKIPEAKGYLIGRRNRFRAGVEACSEQKDAAIRGRGT